MAFVNLIKEGTSAPYAAGDYEQTVDEDYR